jgi:hypothetical protein
MRVLFLSLTFILFNLSLVAQSDLSSFFNNADQFFQTHVENGLINYSAIQQDKNSLNSLLNQIATAEPGSVNTNTHKAFYINAYNLLVISQVIDNYPLASPLEVSGFFDGQQFIVAGEKITLNQLEKTKLLRTYEDARFHFVLVCGALDCPPIIAEAYLPSLIENQLEQQTRRALNDNNFIKVSGKDVALSQIFEWYASDFGGSKSTAVAYINNYRTEALPDGSIRFYNYDWSLNKTQTSRSATDPVINAQGNNAARYVVSAAIPKRTIELKSFANLYTQETGNSSGEISDQATFFTENISALYGVSNRFNAGIDIKYRQVSFGPASGSRFDVFNLEQTANTRQGFTGIGPKIRYAPFTALPNFSIQSTYWIAIGEDLAGNDNRPFIDFNGDVWFTQIFNDFPIGDNFSIFMELDILWEDIGAGADDHINRFSTPVQSIFSYFPNRKTTLYALGSYSPYWQEAFDYFYQAGLGAKYQINRKLELEVLFTHFRNSFIRDTNGTASTLNFGARLSVF